MLNFNNAEEQKEVGSGNGPIPPKSIVKVKMTVREPSEKKRSNIHQVLTVSATNTSNHFLDCEFEVVAGTYEGLKIWQNYVVSGSEKATNISMSFLRAVLESARGIQPTDSSPQATQARQLNDWRDFTGMEFPVLVGVKKPKSGDLYINNDIMRAITPDKPEYQAVMAGGEVISELPIPEIPGAPAAEQNGGWGNPPPTNTSQTPKPQAWGQQQPSPNMGPEPPVPVNKPAWA